MGKLRETVFVTQGAMNMQAFVVLDHVSLLQLPLPPLYPHQLAHPSVDPKTKLQENATQAATNILISVVQGHVNRPQPLLLPPVQLNVGLINTNQTTLVTPAAISMQACVESDPANQQQPQPLLHLNVLWLVGQVSS